MKVLIYSRYFFILFALVAPKVNYDYDKNIILIHKTYAFHKKGVDKSKSLD
jgi:hypothetical protein